MYVAYGYWRFQVVILPQTQAKCVRYWDVLLRIEAIWLYLYILIFYVIYCDDKERRILKRKKKRKNCSLPEVAWSSGCIGRKEALQLTQLGEERMMVEMDSEVVFKALQKAKANGGGKSTGSCDRQFRKSRSWRLPFVQWDWAWWGDLVALWFRQGMAPRDWMIEPAIRFAFPLGRGFRFLQ